MQLDFISTFFSGKHSEEGKLIEHMWEQEKVHLATFDEFLPRYRARPTALLPIWHVAGYALGAGTALMGTCMLAVECQLYGL